MAEKTFSTRIVHKHDIEENWLKAVNFIPKQGEIIIYDIDDNCTYERMKIGDGVQGVNDLPFSDDSVITAIDSLWENINEEKNKLADISTAVEDLNTLVGDTSISDQISEAIATKQDKNLIVEYQAGSKSNATHNLDEICNAAEAGIEVKFFDGYEYLNLLEHSRNQGFAVFYVDYFDMTNKLTIKYIVVGDNGGIMMSDNQTYNVAYKEDLNAKQDILTGIEGQIVKFDANGKPVAVDLNLEAITNETIDEICGGEIENVEDVMF